MSSNVLLGTFESLLLLFVVEVVCLLNVDVEVALTELSPGLLLLVDLSHGVVGRG